MATPDQIRAAIAALSTTYPQFVQKELSSFTNEIASLVQGFSDPLAAVSELNLDSIIESATSVDTENATDSFGALASAAAGLTEQYVRREVQDIQAVRTLQSEASKRIQEVQVLGEKVVQVGVTTMSIFSDLPYAAAQRVCALIRGLGELKVANLECLQKHVVQLLNSILVLVKATDTYRDDTLADLRDAKDRITAAQGELTLSLPVSGGTVGFDETAFARARAELVEASRLLAPPTSGSTVLDVDTILATETNTPVITDRESGSVVQLSISSLTNLIQSEVTSYANQASAINFFVEKLQGLISDYRGAMGGDSVATQRVRVIQEIQKRLLRMCSAMEIAISRNSIETASGQMLLWTSRVRSVISSMDDIGRLDLQEGSSEGEEKAAELSAGLTDLIDALSSIQAGVVTDGIEDATQIRDQLLSLVSLSRNVVAAIETGTQTENQLATLHSIAVQVGQDQLGFISGSIATASIQAEACLSFEGIEVSVTDRLDELLGSMRQLGLDRGADLLGSGQFQEFLNSGLERLSYTGAVVNALAEALEGIDDRQTRERIIEIRDGLIAERSNVELAAADSGDQGLTRAVDRIKDEISNLQRNAKLVESIASDLRGILERAGEEVGDAFGTVTDFLGNLDRLSVDAGGRLSETLEKESAFANAGVVRCE